jgi:hypothetical protein
MSETTPAAAEPLQPKDYIATVRLSDAKNKTLALPGERCEKVPADAIGWLSKQKLIEPATPELRERLKASRRRTTKKAKP